MNDFITIALFIDTLVACGLLCLMWDVADSLRYIGARLEDIDNGIRKY